MHRRNPMRGAYRRRRQIMSMNRSPIFRIIIALTVLALPVAAFARDEVGKASGGGSAIEWQLKSHGHDRVDVSILGPDGTTWSKSFSAGKNPSIRLSDLGGAPEDGQYNVHMIVVPKISDDVKNKLKASRAANDEAAARKIIKDAGITALSQAASFRILNGMIVSPDGTESDANDAVATSPRGIGTNAVKPKLNIATEDQVIPDDLIVQGSTCTGFDCVNNESFGFDTLRLKENNLRIHFEDTSTSAGYPANDWRIIANGSNAGDANFLSVEDSTAARTPFLIEAGAPASAIYIDSTGNIGFQQSAPGLDLHLTTGDTPALRLEQTNAQGFTAQTWDIGGNEANFFIRDLTGGSRLSFRIRPGAPTSSIDISASGNVGIGTASPQRLLHLTSSSGNAAIQITNSTAKSWHIANAGNDLNVSETGIADGRIYAQAGGNVGLNCNAPGFDLVIASGGACATPSSSINAGSTQFTAASSRTFKENISAIAVPDVLDKISKVGVYNYDFINGPKDRIGLIAEDFHEVLGRGDEKYIDGGEVQVALWLAVQQLTAQNKALTERLNALDKELASQPKQ
jgi:hypothetical protein